MKPELEAINSAINIISGVQQTLTLLVDKLEFEKFNLKSVKLKDFVSAVKSGELSKDTEFTINLDGYDNIVFTLGDNCTVLLTEIIDQQNNLKFCLSNDKDVGVNII